MITGKPLFTVEQIQARVKELAEAISSDYKDDRLLVVPILRGAFMFASDLVREIRVQIVMDFITAASYVKTDTTGEVKIPCDLRESIRGKKVLLVEDIVDTGITLNYVRETLLQREPESLRICAFLDKKERRIAEVPLDYVGFRIPNLFVVGYGLDYENMYRNLPYISVFKKST